VPARSATLRRVALAAALAALVIAFFPLRPKPTAGPVFRDFESYYAAGVTWRYHGDPYGRDVWRTERTIPQVDAARDELLPFVGPPFGLPLWNAFGNCPWPVATALWGTILGLSLGAIAFGSLRLARVPSDALDALAVLVVAAGFGPLTSGVALGQAAVVSCAAIVVVPFLLGPRRVFGASAALLAAALQPNLAVALVARLGGIRMWIAALFAATVALGGSLIATGGPAGCAHYLETLRAHAAAERFLAIQTTPAAVARALGASAALAGTVAIVLALAAVAGVAWQCASRRYAADDRLALACAALPLILPFAHEHDFTIVFFPALVAVRRARGVAWVVAAFAFLAVGTDWLGLAQRATGAYETAALTLAAALGTAVLARDRLRPYHLLPALAALAVLAVASVAAGHPLPTWPDALAAGFHERFDVPAAVVWHDEQIQSGIGALVPLWGALRLVSLAGCALVWLVAGVVLRAPRYGAGDSAALGSFFQTASAAGGNLSMRLRNIVSCQSCSADRVAPNAGIAVKRMP